MIHTLSEGELLRLVHKAQSGDADAFAQLYAGYHVLIRTIARSKGDAGTVDDIVQETFTLAYRHLRTLHDPTRFGPWLMQITRNCCKRAGSKQSKQQETVLEENQIDFTFRNNSITPVESAELRIEVQQLLAQLPEKYGMLLRLRYLGDSSIEEIAAFTGLSVTTVKWRIHRALELGRLQLIKEADNKRIKKRRNDQDGLYASHHSKSQTDC